MPPESGSESHDLIRLPESDLATIDQVGAAYDAQSRAASTKRAYTVDWGDFCAWCADLGLDSLPAAPTTVARYLAQLADGSYTHVPPERRRPLKVATLTRWLASINQAHQLAGYLSPTLSELVRTRMKGIRRAHGTQQEREWVRNHRVAGFVAARFTGEYAGEQRELIALQTWDGITEGGLSLDDAQAARDRALSHVRAVAARDEHEHQRAPDR
jgi:hypothetical protein